tara:strand:+ start:8435 stop:8899 length:465 start_codon:yes stop_codon:yes gene_type:complete
MLNFNNTDCYCCGKIRSHRRAKWTGCLKFDKPVCPTPNIPTHNVLAQSNAQHSRKMRNVRKLNSGGRWRKVNWRRFQLQSQTKQYHNKIISNNQSKIAIRCGTVLNPIAVSKGDPIKTNCSDSIDLTWDKISKLSQDVLSKYIGKNPITCGNIE